MSDSRAAGALIGWDLANRARRVIVCRVTEDLRGGFVLRVELEGEEILREHQLSESEARRRADRLRTVLAAWADTT